MRYTKVLIVILFVAMSSINLNAQITIDGDDLSVPMYPKMAGYNSNTTNLVDPWSQTGRQESWIKGSSGLIRYPGGTVSTYWDCEKGRLFGMNEDIDISDGPIQYFVQKKHVINWVVTFNNGVNSVPDLNELVKETKHDTEVMFVLNMVTPGADYYEKKWDRTINQNPQSNDWWSMMDDRYNRAMVMLEEAEDLGIPIKYIEFGNEYFFGVSNSGTGANGGSTVEPYSAGSLNDSKISGAFPFSGQAYAAAVNNWSAKLKTRFPGVKLCAIGSDANSDNASRRNDWNEKVLKDVDPDLVDAVSFHIYGGFGDGDVISNENNLAKAISHWKEKWVEDSIRSKMPKGFDYWFTEFDGSSNKANDGESSWGLGLATISSALRWLSSGNLGIINFHQFTDAGGSGTLKAFGRAYSYLGKATNNCSSASRLKLTGTTILAEHVEDIEGWKFSNNPEGDERYLFINYSGTPKTISLQGINRVSGVSAEYSSQDLSSLNDQNFSTITLSDELTIPAFGLATFTIPVDPTLAKLNVTRNDIKIGPDGINFGVLDLNQPETLTYEFEVKNVGSSTLTFADAPSTVLTGDANNEFTLNAANLTGDLLENETATFTVSFLQNSEGGKNAQVSISSNSINSPFVFSLRATVIDYYSQIEVSETSLNFGNVLVNDDAVERTFDITNTGTDTLFLDESKSTFSGNSFSIVKLPSEIAPGETEIATLAYDPSVAGTHEETFLLASDSRSESSKSLTLKGKAEANNPILLVYPTNIVKAENGDYPFGDLGNELSKQEKIIVKNNGNDLLNITNISFSGDMDEFSISHPTLPAYLGIDQFFELIVDFNPTKNGSFSMEVAFENNSSEPDYSITLTGSQSSLLASETVFHNISIYPTLWTNSTALKIRGAKEMDEIEIFDLSGKQVGQKLNISEISTHYPPLISQMEPGVYILKIRLLEANKTATIKVIKK